MKFNELHIVSQDWVRRALRENETYDGAASFIQREINKLPHTDLLEEVYTIRCMQYAIDFLKSKGSKPVPPKPSHDSCEQRINQIIKDLERLRESLKSKD